MTYKDTADYIDDFDMTLEELQIDCPKIK